MQAQSFPAAPSSLSPRSSSKVSPEGLVRRAAFDLLARREHSQQELISKLSRRFARRPELMVTPELIESVVVVIAIEGLQSDQRYLETFIYSRIKLGYGPVRIAQELKQKGITADQFESLMKSHCHEWAERAKVVREKKFSPGRVMDQKERARQIRFLQYRGFTPEQIHYALGC